MKTGARWRPFSVESGDCHSEAIATFIVLGSIPVACTGGVIALFVARENFSISAAMGFISIFGIAVQDALLMVTYFQQLHVGGMRVEQAARQAAEKRLRAGLMTTLVAMIGLLPAALSHRIGVETQKPLAIVVIGGAIVLTFVTRVLEPPLLVLAWRWRLARAIRREEEWAKEFW